jgi:hypothetical protein
VPNSPLRTMRSPTHHAPFLRQLQATGLQHLLGHHLPAAPGQVSHGADSRRDPHRPPAAPRPTGLHLLSLPAVALRATAQRNDPARAGLDR